MREKEGKVALGGEKKKLHKQTPASGKERKEEEKKVLTHLSRTVGTPTCRYSSLRFSAVPLAART